MKTNKLKSLKGSPGIPKVNYRGLRFKKNKHPLVMDPRTGVILGVSTSLTREEAKKLIGMTFGEFKASLKSLNKSTIGFGNAAFRYPKFEKLPVIITRPL